jgi:anti-sigma regulatory factor (Ser/Thr protein kinase)
MRTFHLRTDSRPESLSSARRQVRRALAGAGLSVEATRDMEVAVGEALSNTYRHAYARGVGPVSVDVLATPNTLTVVVADEGPATIPPAIPLDLPPRSEPGGCGLYVAGRLAGNVEVGIGPAGHGVTVWITAHLRAPVEPPRARPDLETVAADLQSSSAEPTAASDAIADEAADERRERPED